MELKIKEIKENKTDTKNLTILSGYCIISLIVKKIHSNTAGIKDNDIINYEFMEYDYEEENTRMNNEQYSEYANNYIKKIR